MTLLFNAPRVLLLAAPLALLGCGGGTAECGAAECADICANSAPAPAAPAPATDPAPAAGGSALNGFEVTLLQPLLDDVRKGVRPFGDEGIGVCTGEKECDKFLGLTPAAELPPGKHMVRAELAVPNVGDPGTWKVTFETECTTTRTTAKGENATTSNHSRSYDVRYAGKDRGYRLQPLRTIESPSKYGKQVCQYKIIAPLGDEERVYSGSWTVPAAED